MFHFLEIQGTEHSCLSLNSMSSIRSLYISEYQGDWSPFEYVKQMRGSPGQGRLVCKCIILRTTTEVQQACCCRGDTSWDTLMA